MGEAPWRDAEEDGLDEDGLEVADQPELPDAMASAGAPDGPAGFVANAEHAANRLDKALSLAWPALSRSRIKTLIEKGLVWCDGERVTDANAKVRLGGAYRVDVPAPEPTLALPEPIPLDILFEDDHVLVVNKPIGMAVHPAPGSWRGTLVNAVLAHCGADLARIGAPGRPGIVHRLDKDTSGVMVVAKSDTAMTSLGKQFIARRIDRRYRAFTIGAPKEAEGRIQARIARDANDRKRMSVVSNDAQVGKAAITNWLVVARYGAGIDGRPPPAAAELECRLETGRTHQIRVHLAHLGAALIGDTTYGANRAARALDKVLVAMDGEKGLSRQALHAEWLGFTHPYTSQRLEFHVDLPPDLLALRARLQRL